MSSLSYTQRHSRPRAGLPTHLFAVGQSVRLRDGFARPTLATDIYRITATLPPRGNSPQYRIRNDDERHERVTTQDSIELIAVPAEDVSTVAAVEAGGQG